MRKITWFENVPVRAPKAICLAKLMPTPTAHQAKNNRVCNDNVRNEQDLQQIIDIDMVRAPSLPERSSNPRRGVKCRFPSP